MRNRHVLPRALFGLLAATLGGAAASAGAMHLRSPLMDTARATTFSCGQRMTAGGGLSRPQRAVSARPSDSRTVCETARPYRERISGGAQANEPPVVAVVVPVHGRSKTHAVRVIHGRSRHENIFVDKGSVSYGGVTYCSRSCPTVTAKSGSTIVPVTVVDVPHAAHKRKTATNQ